MGTLRGTTVYDENGFPLLNAKVDISSDGGEGKHVVLYTTDDGTFAPVILPVGTVSVVGSAPGLRAIRYEQVPINRYRTTDIMMVLVTDTPATPDEGGFGLP